MLMTYTIRRLALLPLVAALIATSFIALPAGAQEATAEPTSDTTFAGQLIELSSTDLPTTVIIRENPEGEFTDHTVEITSTTEFIGKKMDEWITGDFLSLTGVLNENTDIVTAGVIRNLSINDFRHRGLNGWISAIDLEASTMTVDWRGESHVVTVTDATRMVVPPTNPAALSDFEVGDRVRLRLNKKDCLILDGPCSDPNEAAIIVALRRGNEIFLKARTRSFRANLEEIVVDDQRMTVRLAANDHLRKDDVNNLVGITDELVTITWDDHTKIVRRFFGKATPDELVPGDNLQIVGRVGDDGIIHARMVKDNSIFRKNVARHRLKVLSIDTQANRIETQVVRSDRQVTVVYDELTTIKKNGAEVTEGDLAEGDILRVRGVANSQTLEVDADLISARSLDHKPVKRIRALTDIVTHRIRTSLGKVRAEEIVENQADVTESEAELE